MDREDDNLKRSASDEDEAIAYALADALSDENVEKFLQLYDDIPATVSAERLSNIKEMARQVAALTRTSTYRHSPIPGKDSSYFGINHPRQSSQLSMNGSLGSTDFSAYKTPPEGCTPVDTKHFDYEEEALKSLGSVHSNKHVNNSVISPRNNLPDLVNCEHQKFEKHGKTSDPDVTKADDDAFHTPPEFQDDTDALPPFGYPPSSDKLITSVISLLSKTSTDNKEEYEETASSRNEPQALTDSPQVECKIEVELETEDNCQDPKFVDEEKCSSAHGDNVHADKDSLEGSPSSQRSFVQEEDDSGISTVDENDVSRDSPTDSNFSEKKVHENSDEKAHVHSYGQRPSVSSEKRTKSLQSESKYVRSSVHDAEDSIGWQTRNKRMGRKRIEKDFERKTYHDTDVFGQNENSNLRDFSKRGTREGRNKDKSIRIDKPENYSKASERVVDNFTKGREGNVWTYKKSEDNDMNEIPSLPSPRRLGRRNGPLPYNGKKSEGRWGRNGSSEKYSEIVRHKEISQEHRGSDTTQQSTFSYRDALLKAGTKASRSKNTGQQNALTPKMNRTDFDLHSAASYLLSAWTTVNNLHKKDPSKVYIYGGD